MNKINFKDLRKETLKDFSSIDELLAFTKGFFKVNDVYADIPKTYLVAGHHFFNPQEWKVVCLKPYSKEDQTTVKRFLEGLQHLSDEIKVSEKNNDAFHKGEFMYQGVDDLRDASTMFVSIRVNAPGTSYSLQLDKPYGENIFLAKTSLPKTVLQSIVGSYIGPK
ncbi:MAG: hypothetical protein ACLFNM_02465 [Candidatus Woesearchaeota archaeon]